MARLSNIYSTALPSARTDAIVEGETIGYGLSINNTRFGVWVNDVTVLSDLDATALDDLIENSNPTCGDLANEEPLLNYLRASEKLQIVDSLPTKTFVKYVENPFPKQLDIPNWLVFLLMFLSPNLAHFFHDEAFPI